MLTERLSRLPFETRLFYGLLTARVFRWQDLLLVNTRIWGALVVHVVS